MASTEPTDEQNDRIESLIAEHGVCVFYYEDNDRVDVARNGERIRRFEDVDGLSEPIAFAEGYAAALE